MTITVFGGTGPIGKRIVRMALALNHSIRAFGQNVQDLIDEDLRNKRFEAIKGYMFDKADVFNAIKGSDIVLSALDGSADSTDKTRSLGIKNIIAQMQKADLKRIIAVGGLGVLKDDRYEYVSNRPDYPALYKQESMEHLQAYKFLKASDLDWTLVCCPDIKDKEATHNYITNAEYPPVPNNYWITAGDTADFMLKEINNKQYINIRVGISNL